MAAGLRKLVLTIHLSASLGWVGSVMAYAALGISATRTADAEMVRSAWTAMDLVGWVVIVPLAVAALVTGVVISLGTPWGLFRHYWVLVSLGLTIVATAVLLLHMPSVSATARIARESDRGQLTQLGGDLGHAVGGLVVLLVITVLNVYKPQGLTPYGWRKQQELRATPTRHNLAGTDVPLGMTFSTRNLTDAAAPSRRPRTGDHHGSLRSGGQ
jgi:uncharacterized membrane protein